MKKCYIAGKISGLSEEEYTTNFNGAKSWLQYNGYQVVSPIDLPHKAGSSWAEYLKLDIKNMLDCHSVYVLKNWAESRGAVLEVNIALTVEMNVMFEPS